MIYLSQLVGNPVLDVAGQQIGTVSDLGIATREVFPRVTSLAVMGPGKTPYMISWRKYVESYDDEVVRLAVEATDIRFSFLQLDEVLLARDILNKQIVDTRGMRVVRVNDLKLSDTSSSQLRLLGADVGARGMLRSLSPALERGVLKIAKALGKPMPERIIAWSYMDLVERNLSAVKLSVSHKTLDNMHPADIADIIERLDPRLRGQVFAQLDDEQRAEAMAELDDDTMAADLVGSMADAEASRLLSAMDPDDAAELVSELDYDKAEKLLHLMGVKEEAAIRQLLGYRDESAGRIMTSEVVALPTGTSVGEAIAYLRTLDEDFEAVRYVYINDEDGKLAGVVALSRLIIADDNVKLDDIAATDLIVAHPNDDQENVALDIAKYNLLAMPVVDDAGKLLGIVTVDDALDVLEEEHAEDLQIAGASHDSFDASDHTGALLWMLRRNIWAALYIGAALAAGACLTLLGHAQSTQAIIAGLVCALALPIALIVTDDALSYTTSVYLNFNEDDEDAPSKLGFALKMLGLGLVFGAALILLDGLIAAIANALPNSTGFAQAFAPLPQAFHIGTAAAALALFISVASMPIYLATLRARDAANKDTSGWLLSVIAMAVTTSIFLAGIAAALCLGLWVG